MRGDFETFIKHQFLHLYAVRQAISPHHSPQKLESLKVQSSAHFYSSSTSQTSRPSVWQVAQFADDFMLMDQIKVSTSSFQTKKKK